MNQEQLRTLKKLVRLEALNAMMFVASDKDVEQREQREFEMDGLWDKLINSAKKD